MAPSHSMSSFRRKYLRAQLRREDRFWDPSPVGIYYSRPADFLRAGRSGRIAQVAWRLFMLVFSVAVSGAMLAGIAVVCSGDAPWPILFAIVPLLAFGLALALDSQALLRWMARNFRR